MAERPNAENALLSLWTPWPTPRRGCRCAWAAGVVADHDAYRSRGRVAPQRTQPRGHTPWIDHPDLASATCTRHARGTDPPAPHRGPGRRARHWGATPHAVARAPRREPVEAEGPATMAHRATHAAPVHYSTGQGKHIQQSRVGGWANKTGTVEKPRRCLKHRRRKVLLRRHRRHSALRLYSHVTGRLRQLVAVFQAT